MKRFLSLILVLLCSVSSILAQTEYEFNEHSTNAYHDILKLKINAAKEHLRKSEELYPSNGINIYLANYIDMVQLVISEDHDLFKELAENEQDRLKVLAKLDQNSPYYNFLRGEIKIHWTLVKLKFGKELAAFSTGMSAYKILKRNAESFPDFLPNRKPLGAAKVLIGALPSKHKKYASLAGLKGDVNEGLADLQSVIDSESPFRLEAKIIYFWLQSYVLNESDEALATVKQLLKKYPDNLSLHILGSMIARNAGKARESYKILNTCPQGDVYMNLPFLEYIRAEVSLQMGNYYASLAHSKQFIKTYKGQSYIKASYYRMFLAYWFLDDSRANQFLEKVKTEGVETVIPDKYAAKFVVAELPNRAITQARMYTDGGELEKAALILAQIDPEKLDKKKDQLEYYYRKARILHKSKRYHEAVLIYKQAMSQTNQSSPYYFGANTALQLGYIYQDEFSDYTSASYYFNLALEFDEHEYKSSIDNKAKAALSRLKKGK